MQKEIVRNILVGGGAYYASMWVAPLVVMAFAPITNRFVYSGDFQIAVVAPIVLGLPMALVAAGTGVLTAWLVQSPYRLRWAFLPAVLYAAFEFLGVTQWIQPPTAADRVGQIIGALVPAAGCVVGAWRFSRYHRRQDGL